MRKQSKIAFFVTTTVKWMLKHLSSFDFNGPLYNINVINVIN